MKPACNQLNLYETAVGFLGYHLITKNSYLGAGGGFVEEARPMSAAVFEKIVPQLPKSRV
jgi:hypothetical protein